MPLLELLRNTVFSNKLVQDDRKPIFTFDVPESLFGGEGDTMITYGLVAPEIMFWPQNAVILALHCICGSIAGYIIYKYIVQKRGSATSYLVGYGVIIPMCIAYPYVMVPILELQNKILRFIQVVLLPVMTMFRCSEAMHGFSPPSVENSLKNFMIYYANICHITFDPKTHTPIKATWKDFLEALRKFIGKMCFSGAIISVLAPFDYQPFKVGGYLEEEESSSILSSVRDLFHWRHLLNNFAGAVIFELYLDTMLAALVAITTIWGLKPQLTMVSALLGSTSPSDFWGRRWNLVVHSVLKRGVFKPVRRYFSRHIAMAAAFLASGLFHEWILYGIFAVSKSMDPNECTPRSCHTPIYGNTVGFFLWNGVIIAMEYLVGHFIFFQWVKRTFPIPIVSLMVVSLALPVAHWMTHNYIASDYFQNGELGFPMIVKVSRD